MLRTATAILSQVTAADLMKYVVRLESHGEADEHLHGWLDLAALDAMRQDARLLEGPWHLLHADVGEPRTEFRSLRGSLGDGSMQIVINTASGYFYADIDRHSTEDVVNIVGHLFGEVLGPKLRKLGRLFRRRR